MIIQGAVGDDLAVVEGMESELCRKHHVARKLLYPLLRQADFHRTHNDPPEHWNTAAYAAFSGVVLPRTLGCDQLKSLLADFEIARESNKRAWASVMADEMKSSATERRNRDHFAVGNRYACAAANDYVFPEPFLMGRLNEEQRKQHDSYLVYISEHALIPAAKPARQACQRQLDDLAKSHAAVIRAARGVDNAE